VADEHDREAGAALEPRAPAKPATQVRSYHVALSPKQVLERLTGLEGVKAYESDMLPDFGGLIEDADFTVELLGKHEFTIHCGPPAARGQSATGVLRLLYLHGRMHRTEDGTLLDLRFAYRRPRWALQRWIGLLALAGFGLAWVVLGPGIMLKKALLYGVLLLVLGPVVVHDLRRGERLDEQSRELLNLLERSFGPIEIDQPHPDEPYRRRLLAEAPRDRAPLDARRHAGSGDDEDDEDDDEDDDWDGRRGDRA
jgi:hypothetical protein